MSFQGTLEDFPLPRLLKMIAEGEKTGALSIEFVPGGQSKRQSTTPKTTLYFKEGVLVSLGPQDEDQVGIVQVLKDRGLIPPHRQEELLSAATTRSEKELAVVLLAAGVVSRRQLLQVMEEEIGKRVLKLLQFKEGRFLFQYNTLPPEDRVTVRIPGERLLLQIRASLAPGQEL